MTRNAAILAMVCVTLMLATAGCGEGQEIESVGFIMGVGIDEAENGRIRAWVQSAIPSAKPSESAKEESWLASAEGATVWEALRNVGAKSGKVLFLAHVRSLIIGERFARSGLKDLLDVLARVGEFRAKSWVVVTSDPVDRILGVQSPQASIAASYINALMRNAGQLAVAPRSTVLSVIAATEEAGLQPVIARAKLVPQMSPQEETPIGRRPEGKGPTSGPNWEGGAEGGGAASEPGGAGGSSGADSQAPSSDAIELSGAAAFRADKMMGWLSPEDTAMLLIVKNAGGEYSFIHDLPRGRGTVAVSILSCRASFDLPKPIPTSVDAFRGARVVIRIRGEVDIRELASDESFSSLDEIEALNRGLSKQVEQRIRALVAVSQDQYGTDLLGMGEAFRQRISVQRWERDIAPRWHEVFRTLEIEPEARLEVRRRGMTVGSPKPRA